MSACSMRVVPWLVVGVLLATVATLPVWQADGLSLDQFLVFSLPVSLFAVPVLTLCCCHCELQDCLELPQGAPSLHSARAPPRLQHA
jgi:hypothetical protein